MKRILVLMTVVAMMVGMMAMSVAPAFADQALWVCAKPGVPPIVATPKYAHGWSGGYPALGYTCTKQEVR
jgi:hypothetical protein